jgi:shikimate kinase
MRNLVFLTGFMGTGKTVVGRELARRLGRRFIDLDDEIERAAGRSVREIFERSGEADFRAREREALERVCRLDAAVVATGGGTPVDPVNRRVLRAAGNVICLGADVPTILARVGDGQDRPLLAGTSDRSARIRWLLEARAEAYADADHGVDTSGREVDDIVGEITAWLDATDSSDRETERH